ncbi:hypothetical protein [Streptomyces sp. NPDC048606]|uniref:hypothetical protein n=1 Tax=Streptomyces sp. NPDC048606 TaxID=3154726 RepID=UPI00341DAE4D
MRHFPDPPRPEAVLHGTDWASAETPCGTGASLPAALARLVDPDPLVRKAALGDSLGRVTHQNSIYGATPPVALYVAAILDHPALAVHDSPVGGGPSPTPADHPTLVSLLDWLGDTARDADDACAAIAEDAEEGPDEPMRAFRELRPVLFSAVHPFLGHADADVRDLAFLAAVPLAEHPDLAAYHGALAAHARRLLTTGTDRRHRDRALRALRAWGHDTADLENASDVEARERYARYRAERASVSGGYSAEPPF